MAHDFRDRTRFDSGDKIIKIGGEWFLLKELLGASVATQASRKGMTVRTKGKPPRFVKCELADEVKTILVRNGKGD